jgi:hypothetical protein
MGIVSTASLIREQSGSRSTGLTPGAKVVDAAAVGLEGVEGESIGSKGHDRGLRAGNTALSIGHEIPTPNPTADCRGQLTHRKTPTSSQHTPMAFFGLRKWSTPVSARLL